MINMGEKGKKGKNVKGIVRRLGHGSHLYELQDKIKRAG
jgi:hypothetical protein